MTIRAPGLPLATLALVGAAALATATPGAAALLEYDRARVAAGEIWRPLTGQAVHWGARMALADLGALLLLGAWVERRERLLLLVASWLAIACVGSAIHFAAPEVARYRGASGLASAWFVLAAALAADGARTRTARVVALCGLALFAVKLLAEALTGRALVAGPLGPGVSVLPLAHLAGGLAGALAYAAMLTGRSRCPSRSAPARPARAPWAPCR